MKLGKDEKRWVMLSSLKIRETQLEALTKLRNPAIDISGNEGGFHLYGKDERLMNSILNTTREYLGQEIRDLQKQIKEL